MTTFNQHQVSDINYSLNSPIQGLFLTTTTTTTTTTKNKSIYQKEKLSLQLVSNTLLQKPTPIFSPYTHTHKSHKKTKPIPTSTSFKQYMG